MKRLCRIFVGLLTVIAGLALSDHVGSFQLCRLSAQSPASPAEEVGRARTPLEDETEVEPVESDEDGGPERAGSDEWEWQIQGVRSQRRLAGERIKLLDAKLEWLTRQRGFERSIAEAEKELEEAEARDDRLAPNGKELSDPEELEAKLRRSEIDIEEAEGQIELLEGRLEVNRLQVELTEMPPERRGREVQRRLSGDAKKLDRFLTQRTERIGRYFDALREGEDEAVEEWEVDRERSGERFEIWLERIYLERELFEARERDDEEAVEELEFELRSIRRSEGRLDEPRGDTASATPLPDWARPVVVSEDEIRRAGALGPERAIVSALKDHCFECHSGESAEADLDLAAMARRRPLVLDRERWENVRRQVEVGSMPPSESERIDLPRRRQLVAGLRHAIDHFDYETIRTVGYEPARRLTHREYDNAVSDLFGTPLHPTNRFPVDMTSQSGFENNASALTLDSLLLERYAGAAESVVDQVFPETPTSRLHDAVRRSLLGDDSYRNALARFAGRAFRRDLDEHERSQLANRFDALVAGGESEVSAFRKMVRVVLLSPSFLIRSELVGSDVAATSPADTDRRRGTRITGSELASRLSFFLWSSIPDETLMRAASTGGLFEDQTLRAEIDRMIDDPRSKALGDHFAIQWLGLSNLHRVQRDPIDNPWATDSLVRAMREETSLFFQSLVRDDAPIERLVDADYTFLNDELAAHYEIDAELNSAMSRVAVDPTRRGGVLAHGGVLAVTSFPHRTSPVVRGDWILSTLLGTPPPPPPPNVSEFDPEVAEDRRLSPRERLQLHRENPNCNACHSQIDPLGFALERYDWFGRRRGGRDLDVRGQLPGGAKFEGLQGLKRTLIESRRDDLVRQASRMMMEYALGRTLDPHDEAALREIVAETNEHGRRFRELVFAIVRSETFQRRLSGPSRDVVFDEGKGARSEWRNQDGS